MFVKLKFKNIYYILLVARHQDTQITMMERLFLDEDIILLAPYKIKILSQRTPTGIFAHHCMSSKFQDI